MHIFFIPNIDSGLTHYELSEEESKHCVRVLRLGSGSEVLLINGKGGVYTTEIVDAHPKRTKVKVLSFIQRPRNRNFNLHILVAPTKNIERFEWFLEKTTEIGIDEITPIICDRSERKEIKLDRLNKIIIAAMKQSQQYYLPKLNEPVKLSDFFNYKVEGEKFIAHCLDNEKHFLHSLLKPDQDAVILIGPEGDFSTTEIDKAISTGFIPITLGNTRLRTETAAIVACLEMNLINR